MSSRKVFISAGHSNQSGRDRGAVGCGEIEGDLTSEFRQLLCRELDLLRVVYVKDVDDSVFSESIRFFKNLTASNSIVVDIHFNASSNPKATGSEVLIPWNPSLFEVNMALAIAEDLKRVLGLPLRGHYKGNAGLKTELESHHGRLGWMRLNGENILLEIGFISNQKDIDSYHKNKFVLAKAMAQTILKYSIAP